MSIMTIEQQIKAMRDEAEAVIATQKEVGKLRPEVEADAAGFVRGLNGVLALLDVLAEVEGWVMPEHVQGLKAAEKSALLTVIKYPYEGWLPVRILILRSDACPHCGKPLVKETQYSDGGLGQGTTNWDVCAACKEAVDA